MKTKPKTLLIATAAVVLSILGAAPQALAAKPDAPPLAARPHEPVTQQKHTPASPEQRRAGHQKMIARMKSMRAGKGGASAAHSTPESRRARRTQMTVKIKAFRAAHRSAAKDTGQRPTTNLGLKSAPGKS